MGFHSFLSYVKVSPNKNIWKIPNCLSNTYVAVKEASLLKIFVSYIQHI